MEQGHEHRVLEPGQQQGLLTSPAPGAYEQIAYPGYVYPRTHPARLEVIARLFGLRPPPARTARVIEVGCGDGGNALAVAQTLPSAHIIAIDVTPGPLQGGRALAAEAGLANVELRCADVLDEEQMRQLGPADYVIAHGVYSWIPPAARGALLDLCRRSLAPEGVAFISFNAYPGSYLRDMARDVLAYHLRDVAQAPQRIAEAHALMEAIVSVESPSPYARVLREHLQRMLSAGDALLYHDDLAPVSTPFYFHEFMEHAAAHGLQFLSEAELSDSQLYQVPAGVAELIAGLPEDVVVREQYLDFFNNRMFRQTLLVRSELAVTRRIDDAVLEAMAISCPAHWEGDAFTTQAGVTVSTSEPFAAAAMTELCERWPEAVGLDELVSLAAGRLGFDTADAHAVAVLRELLLQAHVAQAVGLLGCPMPAVRPSARPEASPLARAQAGRGTPVVSTLLPGNHRLADETERRLLASLDGTRDVPALARELERPVPVIQTELARMATAGLLIA